MLKNYNDMAGNLNIMKMLIDLLKTSFPLKMKYKISSKTSYLQYREMCDVRYLQWHN